MSNRSVLADRIIECDDGSRQKSIGDSGQEVHPGTNGPYVSDAMRLRMNSPASLEKHMKISL